jgi:putative nucleotidyltransferase with HDIG domain
MNRSLFSAKLEKILCSVDQLRPMPTSITRILQALDSPNVTADLISEYIGLDQALAAMILRVSNSVTLGYSRTCSSLTEAVMRLGFKRVKSLVMASAANGPMDRGLNGYRLGTGEIWNHGIVTAMAAEWLAHELHYPNPEEAYVGGLLHDMGKLLLDQFVFSDYTRIVELMHSRRCSLWQAEQELLGIDHAAVGSLIAEKWQYPVVLIDTIRCHHAPSLARTKPELPALVNFANAIACRNSKSFFDLFNKTVHPETPNILHLNQSSWMNVENKLVNYLSITSSQPQ